jgi:hypothetical protein
VINLVVAEARAATKLSQLRELQTRVPRQIAVGDRALERLNSLLKFENGQAACGSQIQQRAENKIAFTPKSLILFARDRYVGQWVQNGAKLLQYLPSEPTALRAFT